MNKLDSSKVFKALSDETRVKIFEMLSAEELCACKILANFKITQPTLSHHMKTLCEAGLVECRKDGIWNYYSVKPDLLFIKDFIEKIK